MRTLIIPDLHHHLDHAEHWLETQRYDRVVFLGDYFDDYNDNVNDARATARWLRKRMENTTDIFLLGNHDADYMFPNFDALYCPGFTKSKSRAINEILKPEQWRRLKLAHFEQGWLLSHAGFHLSWTVTLSVEQIVAMGDAALRKAARNDFDPLLGCGFDRDGSQPISGPLWLDWDSLVPIAGINQVVGHTPGPEVREKRGKDSRNYCLDVGNGLAAAILEDGELEVLKRL